MRPNEQSKELLKEADREDENPQYLNIILDVKRSLTL